MDQNLHFNVVPKPGGGYTTRIVTQEDLLTAELVASTQAALAARGITLTAEQITAVGEELSKVRIAALARGRVVRRAFGYFTDEPLSAASMPTRTSCPRSSTNPERPHPARPGWAGAL